MADGRLLGQAYLLGGLVGVSARHSLGGVFSDEVLSSCISVLQGTRAHFGVHVFDFMWIESVCASWMDFLFRVYMLCLVEVTLHIVAVVSW